VAPHLAAAVTALAVDLDVPPQRLLRTAHGTVLAALTGNTSDTGSGTAGTESVVDPTWLDGVTDGVTDDGLPVGLADDVVLAVGMAGTVDQPVLRVRYRTDAFDRAHAARIGGYHVTALTRIVEDPDADLAATCLLSEAETTLQVDAMAGPTRPLPDRRVHQLLEDRVRRHPEAVAVTLGDRSWTYDQLNRRANRIGRTLLARGLEREDVVAVVTERTLEWTAAVLAVLKAGGTYLPIEPHFPADRIAATLSRAGCRLVVAAADNTTTLDQALAEHAPLAETTVLTLADETDETDETTDDFDVAVTADQLAYLYFTSGSTGEPKGALCEHAGLLNHLLAKIEDLGITEDSVVAQTAPQCFDISLWQLLAGLLVGGRTVIIAQDDILDVDRFVARLVDHEVTVLQVMPSYLDAVLGRLARRDESAHTLPALRVVSVTGEALTVDLAERWFATLPDIPLVNAYGLTETSDDTNHEVLRRAPDGDRVPLGRPIRNVAVYVVDDDLRLVPLGAPGEIVFSGVCVGRGYVNDPDRTALAFGSDPYRAGSRLYRSGDTGRWRPDGKLDFLGRRDSQVKVNGFRIELGEVAGALAGMPGVGQAAVVVSEPDSGPARLVGFYTGVEHEDTTVRRHLGRTLPAYMVPASYQHHDTLPLTPNGKVDQAALWRLANLTTTGGPVDGATPAPLNPDEERLAAAWADVLGIDRRLIGRNDRFADLGGTSMAAVKLVVALDRAISIQDLAAHPRLGDLAACLAAAPLHEPRAHTGPRKER